MNNLIQISAYTFDIIIFLLCKVISNLSFKCNIHRHLYEVQDYDSVIWYSSVLVDFAKTNHLSDKTFKTVSACFTDKERSPMFSRLVCAYFIEASHFASMLHMQK